MRVAIINIRIVEEKLDSLHSLRKDRSVEEVGDDLLVPVSLLLLVDLDEVVLGQTAEESLEEGDQVADASTP